MFEIQSVKDRLKLFLRYKNLSITKFLDTMGLSRSYIANMRKAPSDEVRVSIAKMFPDLNMDWLIYGTGEMLKGESSAERTDDKDRRIAELEAQVKILKEVIREMKGVSEEKRACS